MALPEIVDDGGVEARPRRSCWRRRRRRRAARRARGRAPAPADDGVLDRLEFEGPAGRGRLPDLFEGRSQLLLYHFWFPEDGEPCGGLLDVHRPDQPARPPARARHLVRARLPRAAGPDPGLREPDGLGGPLVHGRRRGRSSRRCGTTEYFALDVFLRDGDRVFLTYATSGPRRRGARQRLDLPRPDRRSAARRSGRTRRPAGRRARRTGGGACTTSTSRAARRPCDRRPHRRRPGRGAALVRAPRRRAVARAAKPRPGGRRAGPL